MGKNQSVVIPYESLLFENESKLKAMRLVLRNEYTQELFSNYIHNTNKIEYLHYFKELQSMKELILFFMHKQQQEMVDLLHTCLEKINDLSATSDNNQSRRIDNKTHSNLLLCFVPLYDIQNIPNITHGRVVSGVRKTEDNLLGYLYNEFDGFIHSKAFQKIEKLISNDLSSSSPPHPVSMDLGKGKVRRTTLSTTSITLDLLDT